MAGGVPAHWEVRRIREIGRLSKGNGGNKDDELQIGVPCVRYGTLYTYSSVGMCFSPPSGETFNEIVKSTVTLMQSEGCYGWGSIPAGYDAQLRAIRQRRGWNQARLAALLGAARKAVVYQWETRRCCPSPVFQMFSLRFLSGGFGPGFSHRPSTTTSREPPLQLSTTSGTSTPVTRGME